MLDAIRLTAFNVTSVVTTTGFASADYNFWGGFASASCSISPSSAAAPDRPPAAIKIFRFRVMAIVLSDHLLQRFYPHGVSKRTYDGQPLDEDVIEGVLAFAVVYAASVGVDRARARRPRSRLGHQHQRRRDRGRQRRARARRDHRPGRQLFQLPDAAKWLLSFGMLLGRLELFTVIVLLTPRFWRG